MKNVRLRNDGRYEWRKTLNGINYNITKTKLQDLKKAIKNFKPTEKEKTKKYKTIDLIILWYKTYKSNIKSSKNYLYLINKHFKIDLFEKDINKLKLQELQNFINNLKGHRVKMYAYFIIKGTFFTALKNEQLKKDISIFIEKPKNETTKGIAFNLLEQKLIINNLEKTKIAKEIMFYLLTGCRRNEAINLKQQDINFEKNSILIKGTKTINAKRHILISEKYKIYLKENFKNMFKLKSDYITREFAIYLKLLKIKNKTLHDLRHTFATNLYYLGVPDKERQYLMGHSSIVITNDIYTSLDPTITKNDINKLYNNLYPWGMPQK